MMSSEPRHAPFDITGARLRAGDVVRVVGVPNLSGMAAGARRESEPVFQRLVGSYRRIAGFDRYAHAEVRLRFRGGAEAGDHTVWLEPRLLRLRRRRGKP